MISISIFIVVFLYVFMCENQSKIIGENRRTKEKNQYIFFFLVGAKNKGIVQIHLIKMKSE